MSSQPLNPDQASEILYDCTKSAMNRYRYCEPGVAIGGAAEFYESVIVATMQELAPDRQAHYLDLIQAQTDENNIHAASYPHGTDTWVDLIMI